MAVTVLLALPIGAQDADRKPSPFPEKNRQREAEASGKANRSRSPAERPAQTHRGTAPAAADAGREPVVAGVTGKACFFSPRNSGGRAANGDAVDLDELVAAHATYALGTLVRVTNLRNGKTVEVRIVDRLPDTRRIISVSEVAAKRLGFFEAGTVDVRLDPAGDQADGR
jgi:rare lipoprotein A (peptidoglycan hydrolase)